MVIPNAPGAGASEVWNSGDYRNYVRNMMTNFETQYNRRREAESSVNQRGMQPEFSTGSRNDN
jgi:hypothetical protein